MIELAKGANTALTADNVRAVLRWRSGPGVPDVDASALLLRANGRVSSDDDFVFYNQSAHPSGAVRHAGKQDGADTIEVVLSSVPPQVERIVLAASADGGTFGQVPDLALEISDASSGSVLARFEMAAASETAFVSGELYRRDGAWKFRAVGQGYDSGLAGLATDFGISVSDEPAEAPPPTVVNLDKGRVNLVKGARVSLVKTGAPPLVRVAMGLGWDPAQGTKKVDLDASAIAFDASGKQLEIVWFMHLSEFRGALKHSGDNLTGEGEGDDERIFVDLSALPENVHSLVFTITSFRGQRFTEIARAFCRLVDEATGQELVRYELSQSEPKTGVVMAMLRRTGPATWEMRAIGEFQDGKTVKKLIEPAGRHAVAP